MFKDYVTTVDNEMLVSMIPRVKPSALSVIVNEIELRHYGRNIANQPIIVWLEVGEDVWESQQVDFKQARKMAAQHLLECRYCWAIVYSVPKYAENAGCCSRLCLDAVKAREERLK